MADIKEVKNMIETIEYECEKAKQVKTKDELLRADAIKTVKAIGYEKIRALLGYNKKGG